MALTEMKSAIRLYVLGIIVVSMGTTVGGIYQWVRYLFTTNNQLVPRPTFLCSTDPKAGRLWYFWVP